MGVEVRVSAISFKGRTAPVTVLRVHENNQQRVEKELADFLASSPEFFKNSLLMLDFSDLDQEESFIDIEPLIHCLRSHGVVPALVGGGTPDQREQALRLHLGWNTNSTKPATPKKKSGLASGSERVYVSLPTLVVKQTVRSGQKIYAKAQDLIVYGAVNPGAEIYADGNIHVYGALRGRALAGGHKNTNARLFCLRLEAELISVAGIYITNEDMDESLLGKTAQAYLADDKLRIEPLESATARRQEQGAVNGQQELVSRAVQEAGSSKGVGYWAR